MNSFFANSNQTKKTSKNNNFIRTQEILYENSNIGRKRNRLAKGIA